MRRLEQLERIFLKIGIDLKDVVCDKTLQRPREKTNGIITGVSIIHLDTPNDENNTPVNPNCDLVSRCRAREHISRHLPGVRPASSPSQSRIKTRNDRNQSKR
jgi:hypothetical protein